MFNWFKPKSPQPQIGDTFRLIGDEMDPWGDYRYHPVTILDIKDGWVRYYNGSLFPDNRLTIESFICVFQKVV